MRFELSNFKNFKNIMIAAEQFLDELKFEADSDGIRFKGLDKSHIAFIGFEAEANYFDEYDINEPESVIIDTNELVKVLKRIKTDDLLIFEFNDTSITIIFQNENTTRTFNLRSIDMEYTSPMIPDITYPCTFTLDYKLLNESLKDAGLYDDKVSFITNEYNFILKAGGEFGDYKSELFIGNSVESHISVFSLEWLQRFFKINNMSKEIVINMGSEMPMLMSMEDEFGLQVYFLLAPRIEVED